jgi:hypothetical protein
MGGTRSMHARNVYTVLVGKAEGKRPPRNPRRRWGMILKWIVQKQVQTAWTEFISLTIRTDGGLL